MTKAEIAEQLRAACFKLRMSSMPLADMIPLMQKAADALTEDAQPACRDDGRCQYAIDSGAEGMGHCPKGKCVMPLASSGLAALEAEAQRSPDSVAAFWANERATFEQWFGGGDEWPNALTRDGEGYRLMQTNQSWNVWKARAAVSAASPAPAAQPAEGVLKSSPVRMNGRIHSLKTDPEVFDAVAAGLKTYEIRLNDRDYQVGDVLWLRRTKHTGQEMKAGAPLIFTGEECMRVVSHVLTGLYGLADGWAVLSFAATPAPSAPAAQPADSTIKAAVTAGWMAALNCHAHEGMAGWSADREKYLGGAIRATLAAIREQNEQG